MMRPPSMALAALVTVSLMLTPISFANAQTTASAVVSTATEGVQMAVAVEGGRIQYWVHGDLSAGKTPILLLHGAFMSAAAMKPLTDRFLAAGRPVIVVDQRGHGHTGDLPGPITYEQLGDDAAAVLADTGVSKADVVGYSMGGGAALQMALRHPDKVAHLVSISASFDEAGVIPELKAMMPMMTADAFAGSAMERDFKRDAPDPDAFPAVVEKIKVMDEDQHWSPDAIRALTSPTMVVSGDYDVVMPEHSVALFRLRGGGDGALASQPFLTAAPPARLAILPGSSHTGLMAQPDLLAAVILPFLDDVTPTPPDGMF